MKKFFRSSFFLIIIVILGGCGVGRQSEESMLEKDYDMEKVNTGHRINFYGVWHIDKAALQSKMYTGTVEDGDFVEKRYDPADYIDLKLEYNLEYFCLGDEKYTDPEYILTSTTVKDFNEGGKFYSPDIYEFIVNEQNRNF